MSNEAPVFLSLDIYFTYISPGQLFDLSLSISVEAAAAALFFRGSKHSLKTLTAQEQQHIFRAVNTDKSLMGHFCLLGPGGKSLINRQMVIANLF